MRTNVCGLGSALCLIALVSGCHQQSQQVADPFLGRTTVPPPGTGQAGQVVPPNPYDASAPSFVPPVVGAPSAGAPPASYAPQTSPAGVPPTTYAPATRPVYQTPPVTAPTYQQGRWRSSTGLGAVEASSAEPVVSGTSTDAEESNTAQNAAEAEHESMARTADAQSPRARTASFRDPRGFAELAADQSNVHSVAVSTADGGAVEPYDLDAELAAELAEVRSASWTDDVSAETTLDVASSSDEIQERQFTQQWQAAAPEPREVGTDNGQLAGWTSPTGNSGGGDVPVQFASTAKSASTVRRTSGNADHGHDREYTQLRGVLEQSRINGSWKLRYIPIDGETDDHGGSVQLQADGVLEGYEHGEAVKIEGHIEAADDAGGGYAPTYLIDSIQRQGV